MISVIVGTRNRPQLIERFVASIVAHTTHPFEVLVGDASDRVPCYESGDSRVRVLWESEPLGYVRGYNALFREARGSYVAFLNDDLEVLPGWSEGVMGLFQRHPKVDLACLPMVEPDEEGAFLLLYSGIPYACMGVARREAGEALGWFDEGYRFYAADPDFSLRLILSGRRLAPVFGPPLVHHKHPDGARDANRAHLERDNRRLQEIWTRRMKQVRRSYRRGSSRYFRGLETRWSEAHQTDALEIPGSDADRPLNPRRPHEPRGSPWWAPWLGLRR